MKNREGANNQLVMGSIVSHMTHPDHTDAVAVHLHSHQRTTGRASLGIISVVHFILLGELGAKKYNIHNKFITR